ncbi:MAG TPA: hypothetical protein EYG85_01330 [Crocinitomix sp.]|nr:hypothetical protein [Crocinitomix sp.]
MNVKLVILFVFMSVLTVKAQDSKLFFGLNVGAKFGNKNYALRYTGAYQNELPLQFDNPNIYQQVFQSLGDKNFTFSQFNERYRYTPAMNLGLLIGYNTSPNLQASIAINFSRLKMLSTYTLEVIDPSNFTTQGQYVTGNILGEESRFNGKFNLDYIFDGDKVRFIIGASGLFLAWRIEKQFAELNNESIILPLFSLHNPNNNITTKTSGMGWGYGVNTGIEFNLNDKFKGQLMYQPYLSRVEYFVTKNQKELLGTSYQKPQHRLEHDLTLRLIWK